MCCTIVILSLLRPLGKKKPKIVWLGQSSAEWQMTRFKVLLLAFMVLLSITHIHLAWIQYVIQSNNINIYKLDLEVLYKIYLNKMYIPELQSILTATHLGVCSRKYYDQHFPHFLWFWSYAPKLLTSPPPNPFRNLTLRVCTLLKSTVFWKLVRQSCLRQSSWEELPLLLLFLFLICPIFPRSLSLAQKLYISCSAQCVFVWNISHSVLVWFLLKRNILSTILWNPFL